MTFIPLSLKPTCIAATNPAQMVLIDAGCEYAHYASDITRTFPVSGTFSDPQRDLYTAVLNAQKECVRRCRVEDGVSMNELHRASCGLLLQELRQIGFKLNVGDVERTLVCFVRATRDWVLIVRERCQSERDETGSCAASQRAWWIR
jgi:hypothetical protein